MVDSLEKSLNLLKQVVKILRDYKEEGCEKDKRRNKYLGWKMSYNCKYEKEFQQVLNKINKQLETKSPKRRSTRRSRKNQKRRSIRRSRKNQKK
jgi:hypothetical protein